MPPAAAQKRLRCTEIGVHRRHGQLDGQWRDSVIVKLLIEEAGT
jgi:hypothetical protein